MVAHSNVSDVCKPSTLTVGRKSPELRVSLDLYLLLFILLFQADLKSPFQITFTIITFCFQVVLVFDWLFHLLPPLLLHTHFRLLWVTLFHLFVRGSQVWRLRQKHVQAEVFVGLYNHRYDSCTSWSTGSHLDIHRVPQSAEGNSAFGELQGRPTGRVAEGQLE